VRQRDAAKLPAVENPDTVASVSQQEHLCRAEEHGWAFTVG